MRGEGWVEGSRDAGELGGIALPPEQRGPSWEAGLPTSVLPHRWQKTSENKPKRDVEEVRGLGCLEKLGEAPSKRQNLSGQALGKRHGIFA